MSLAPAVIYAAMVLPRLGSIWPVIAKPTASGVATLLASPEGATIAWVHFLAFDLFVGRWIYRSTQERGFGALVSSPILFLTLMLSPLGFLVYLILQAIVPSPLKGERNASMAAIPRQNGAQLRVQTKMLLRRGWKTSRSLTAFGVAMLITLLATLAGLLLDQRVVTGAPLWLKPAKFAISVSAYCFTFVWLLGFVKSHPRLARFAANVTVAGFFVEMAVILTQAVRGTTSHFNTTTPLDSFL